MKQKLIIYLIFSILSVLIFYAVSRQNLKKRMRSITLVKDEQALLKERKQKRKKNLINLTYIPDSILAAVNGAALNIRVDEFVLIWISVTLLPALIWNIFTDNLLQTIIIAVIGSILPPLYINIVTGKRREKFANQLGDALMLMSNSLRSGFSFEQSLYTVGENMADPIASEFMTVQRELNVGISLEQSLDSLGERMQNADIRLLTSAVLIQRKVGGNLAEIMDTISKTIQDRIKLKNHIATITAQGKASGILIGTLPIALFVVISMINPEYMSIMYETLFGRILCATGIVMEILGFIVIKKMIDL